MRQVHFDALPGPTHNFGGLSFGNIPSMESSAQVSRPREAALQSLYKMKMMSDLGLVQGIIPPQERPDLEILRRVGFTGNDPQVIEAAIKHAPHLYIAALSSSNLWAANCATITPSSMSQDGRVHITPANLNTQFHRSISVDTTQGILYALFSDPEAFVHHDPLPPHALFGDEGSANTLDLNGTTLFVYGRDGTTPRPDLKYPARQSRQACEALARLHRIKQVRFAQQSPEAINAGIFHNDLAAVANHKTLIYHEKAWVDTPSVVDGLDLDLVPIDLPLEELVTTYLLNSQLIDLPQGRTALMAPIECKDHPLIQSWDFIDKVCYFDLTQSMRNGGGPRCLALSTTLTDSEIEGLHKPLLLSDPLYQSLVEWVNTHYREELKPGDLADPHLLFECRQALDELTDLLDLGPLYPFQQL